MQKFVTQPAKLDLAAIDFTVVTPNEKTHFAKHEQPIRTISSSAS